MKTAAGSHEARGRSIGIVGYGHIGSQVSVLAEALGMSVVFYDIETRLALGNARPLATLEAVLEIADVVTLHVPETPQTAGMIGAAQLARMKPGAQLINASRGTVVDIDALADALRTGRLGGAAIDVFPSEPKSARRGIHFPAARIRKRNPDAAHRRQHGGSPGQHRRRGGRQAAQIQQ